MPLPYVALTWSPTTPTALWMLKGRGQGAAAALNCSISTLHEFCPQHLPLLLLHRSFHTSRCPPCRQFLHEQQQRLPEGRHRVHPQPLIRGVCPQDGGAKGHHVHPGQRLAQNATLQPCMDGSDLRRRRQQQQEE